MYIPRNGILPHRCCTQVFLFVIFLRGEEKKVERAGEMGLTLPSGRLVESLERAKKDLISVAEACLIDVFGNQVSWEVM